MKNNQTQKSLAAFYDQFIQEDENISMKIKPVLNQILEYRVAIKELHIQYGVKFSEMIASYQNRLEDIKCNYETLMSELKIRENNILQMASEFKN